MEGIRRDGVLSYAHLLNIHKNRKKHKERPMTRSTQEPKNLQAVLSFIPVAFIFRTLLLEEDFEGD